MSPAPAIVEAAAAADIAAVRALFLEYARSIDFDLCFQGFEAELAALPGDYAPPGGTLLLARDAGAAVGVVGLRPLEPGVCEMKRLYVQPPYRGGGTGRRLVTRVLDAARALGYSRMRLDTVETMVAAQGLYRRLGFRETVPYGANPVDGLRYFERSL